MRIEGPRSACDERTALINVGCTRMAILSIITNTRMRESSASVGLFWEQPRAAEVVGSLHDSFLILHVVSIAHIWSLALIDMPHDLSNFASTLQRNGQLAVKPGTVPVHLRQC